MTAANEHPLTEWEWTKEQGGSDVLHPDMTRGQAGRRLMWHEFTLELVLLKQT